MMGVVDIFSEWKMCRQNTDAQHTNNTSCKWVSAVNPLYQNYGENNREGTLTTMNRRITAV